MNNIFDFILERKYIGIKKGIHKGEYSLDRTISGTYRSIKYSVQKFRV